MEGGFALSRAYTCSYSPLQYSRPTSAVVDECSVVYFDLHYKAAKCASLIKELKRVGRAVVFWLGYLLTGWLKMQDLKLTDQKRTIDWKCQTWNWRTKPQDMPVQDMKMQDRKMQRQELPVVDPRQSIYVNYVQISPQVINWTRRHNIQKSQSHVRQTLNTLYLSYDWWHVKIAYECNYIVICLQQVLLIIATSKLSI